MKLRRNLILLIFAIAALFLPGASAIVPLSNLLQNGGFENGTTRDTLYWTPEGGPYTTHFGEIEGPEGWVSWWREGFLCTGTPDHRMRRPEVKVISAFPDSERVHGGARAVQWFTFWGCSDGGLLQQVQVTPGQSYIARAYMHSWYSQCSLKPHRPPLDYDCKTLIDWAHNFLSIGLDPEGGRDPLATSVIWSNKQEIYGIYDEVIEVQSVVAQAITMTIFLRSEASHPLKHTDSYYDDVMLFESHMLYLPLIIAQ